jgi:hypothetical protein
MGSPAARFPQAGESLRPHWAALTMAAFADRDAARGVTETYEYHVGGLVFHLTVDIQVVQSRFHV